MSQSSTVEVDADRLSDEVMKDLVDEGLLDEEKAEEYADNLWLEEVDSPDPVRRVSLSEKARNVVEEYERKFVDVVLNRPSAFVSVDSVSRDSKDDIEIIFDTDYGERVRCFDTDSELLGSMLEYKNIDNPKSLEGERFVAKGDSPILDIVIPCNVSSFGKLRYRVFSLVEGARRPTQIGQFWEDVLILMFGYSIFIMPISAYLLDLDSNSTSVLLESAITLFGYSGVICFLISVSYLILQVSLPALREKLRGDFKTKRLLPKPKFQSERKE